MLFDHAVRGETAALAGLELLEAGWQQTPEQLDEVLTHPATGALAGRRRRRRTEACRGRRAGPVRPLGDLLGAAREDDPDAVREARDAYIEALDLVEGSEDGGTDPDADPDPDSDGHAAYLRRQLVFTSVPGEHGLVS